MKLHITSHENEIAVSWYDLYGCTLCKYLIHDSNEYIMEKHYVGRKYLDRPLKGS